MDATRRETSDDARAYRQIRRVAAVTSAGALAPILSVNPAAGVALAVVRKVRNLSWAAVGLVLVAMHPAGRLSGAAE